MRAYVNHVDRPRDADSQWIASAGFTLLEVLVALSILAISSTAVITQIGQSIRQIEQLEQKTVALWIAENQINSLNVAEAWPATGRQSKVLTVANQSWLISTEVSATRDPWLRKVEVSVATDDRRSSAALVTLTAYRGRY